MNKFTEQVKAAPWTAQQRTLNTDLWRIYKMKPITIEDVEWKIECLPEDTPIRGNVLVSGDDEEDRKAEQWVEDQLDSGNEWAWCED